MARYGLIVALGMIAAASPAAAANQDPMPTSGGAPMAGPDAQYCLRAEPITGSRIETIECLTREEWAEGDVDVDREWARDGVRVIEDGRSVS